MNNSELIIEIERLVECAPGTLRPNSRLTDVNGWDSMAALSFVALADSACGVAVKSDEMATCKTVADLLKLVGLQD